MGILSRIFGSAGKAETVPEIDQLIAEATREDQEARTTIAAVEARRNALLIEGDDRALDADDAAKVKAQRTIERVGLAMPDLRRRQQEALARAKAKIVDELLIERQTVIAELRTALEAAADANEKAIAFSARASAMVGYVPVLSGPIRLELPLRELTDSWKAYVAQFEKPQQRPATFPEHVAVAKPVQPVGPSKPPVPYSETLVRRKPATAKPPEGYLRIVMIRAGLELPDGGRSQIGDVIDFPHETAMGLMRNVAADLAPIEDVPEQEASADETIHPDKPKRGRRPKSSEGEA